MILKSSHQPVYREVLSQALRTAWYDRRYWILSLLAGILVSASAYDALARSIRAVSLQSSLLNLGAGKVILQTLILNAQKSETIFALVSGVEILLLVALLALFIIGLSCIAQGGLIFALGARMRGKHPKLREALHVGAGSFWPIVTLNLLACGGLCLARFLTSLPLNWALDQTRLTTYLVYIGSFLIFLPIVFLIAVVQIFALNAVVLHGAPLSAAIGRAWALFTKNWVVTIETAVLQTLLSIGIWILYIIIYLFLMIPVIVFFLAAAIIQSNVLFMCSLAIGTAVFFAGLVLTGAFTIQLQYATWIHLYRKLGEGGIVPKLHRLVQSITGFF